MIVALDFDGTLLTHVWPEVGKDIGAFEWVVPLQVKYTELKYILWTVRGGKPLDDAVEYCNDRGLFFWGINRNPDQSTWSFSNKVYANCYVDDAAIGAPIIHGDEGTRPYINWNEMGPLLTCKVDEHFSGDGDYLDLAQMQAAILEAESGE